MNEKQRLIRNIATLRESINRDWADLFSHSSFSHEERTAKLSSLVGLPMTTARLERYFGCPC
jgi:hypothetical protein